MRKGTGKVNPDHNYISTNTAVQVMMTHIEADPGHDTGIIKTIPGVAHDAQVQHTGVTAINPPGTHHTNHTADHLCTKVPHPTTPEIDVDHIHIHSTNPQDEICRGHTHTPADQKAIHITKETPE